MNVNLPHDFSNPLINGVTSCKKNDVKDFNDIVDQKNSLNCNDFHVLKDKENNVNLFSKEELQGVLHRLLHSFESASVGVEGGITEISAMSSDRAFSATKFSNMDEFALALTKYIVQNKDELNDFVGKQSQEVALSQETINSIASFIYVVDKHIPYLWGGGFIIFSLSLVTRNVPIRVVSYGILYVAVLLTIVLSGINDHGPSDVDPPA